MEGELGIQIERNRALVFLFRKLRRLSGDGAVELSGRQFLLAESAGLIVKERALFDLFDRKIIKQKEEIRAKAFYPGTTLQNLFHCSKTRS